jgi:hypothetical protein
MSLAQGLGRNHRSLFARQFHIISKKSVLNCSLINVEIASPAARTYPSARSDQVESPGL